MTSLKDLGIAYRKAKVDLYYSTHASLEAIANYEEKLSSNLLNLLQKISGEDETWIEDKKFIGEWTLAPKSVEMDCWAKHKVDNGTAMIFSSPAEEWLHAVNALAGKEKPERPRAIFRVMAQCSLDFHVLSTLWMLEVGQLFDAQLGQCAYGNRLRRTQNGKDINKLSLGSFKPYLKPFRDWRDGGIEAMRSALDADKKIVALTADVTSFYHELNPGFMANLDFIQKLGLELTEEQTKLHRLFIRALKAWAAATPLKKGLPVGLPASAIVANVALLELDRFIEKQVVPLYYGRYVDDILLVMENGANFGSTVELWEWLFERSGDTLGWVDDSKKEIEFKPSYLANIDERSKVRFSNGKNKVFILDGEPGSTLVDSISRQIRERASEWRAMPRLPRSAAHVATDLLAATQSDGAVADNLRKTDALTMRRAGFAIKLRDFEAYERDLLPGAWKEHRRAFFRAFVQHVLVLPQFFDLAVYLPRVIRLATACEDFAELRQIIEAVSRLCQQVEEQCKVEVKAWPKECGPIDLPEIMARWRAQVFSEIRESAIAAFPPRLSSAGNVSWKSYMGGYQPSFDLYSMVLWPWSVSEFKKRQARLFSLDLAHMPFRFIGLPKEMVAQRGIPSKATLASFDEARDVLPNSICGGLESLAAWIGFKTLPHGLLFATRPFSLPELFIVNSKAYAASQQEDVRAVVLSVRGFELGKAAPIFNDDGVLTVPDSTTPPKYAIAVSSWSTSLESWTASVMGMPDPDADRYVRLCRLLDGLISQPMESRYFILPELALPARWFMRIARKLQSRGISLISGIEYLHTKGKVRNQVWAAMSHDGLGFPSLMIYRQDKQRPALHEEQEIQRLAGLKLKPAEAWKTPPIIQHGDFRFSMLVCSELTNIRYRADLRGRVDALFVPEWNPDTETFNALVESASLDVHAFIIQCNDRSYGDSRIRAPFKEGWKRDVLRVKGGVTDYCVIGEIDVLALRQFQSNHRSPANPFKPVPDGFHDSMDQQRMVLPKAEA